MGHPALELSVTAAPLAQWHDLTRDWVPNLGEDTKLDEGTRVVFEAGEEIPVQGARWHELEDHGHEDQLTMPFQEGRSMSLEVWAQRADLAI